MAFIKLQADQIFDGYLFHKNKVLVLQPDETVEEIIAIADAGDDIQNIPGILSPGFINCHCHLELSHLKDQIAENTGLAGFVRQVVQKRNFSEEIIFEAISVAETEMLENGIVAVGDICNTTHTFTQKRQNKLYYHNFIEAMGFNPAVADQNFFLYEKIYNQFIQECLPQQVSITPHAPYSVSDPLWEKIVVHNSNGLLSIHNQETEDETLWFMQKTGGFVDMFKGMGLNTDSFIASGKSSLQTYLSKFPVNIQLLLVHNVFTTEADIVFSKQSKQPLFWCLCPNANYFISRLLPDLPMFLKAGSDIVLGTDSLASNHQLSIWEEIKTLQKAFPEIPLETLLQCATSNGAKALKISQQYGSFEKGKRPGVVNITDKTATRLSPTS